jgi:MFS family permease
VSTHSNGMVPQLNHRAQFFVSEDERMLAIQRLAYDGLASTAGAQGHMGHWEAVRAGFSDWRSYLFILLYMLVTGSQTIQYFIPTLIGNLGWTGATGQYHTIPVYASAFVFILGCSFVSDRFEIKPLMITLVAGFGTSCFIATVATTNHMVQYVFLILAFGAVFALPPLSLTWVPNIISFPAEKRAVAIALVNALGQSASIYGVFLWPSTDAPRYIPGFSATSVWMFGICILAQVMAYMFRKYPLVAPDVNEVMSQEIGKRNRDAAGQA